jgi:hypothetical protein
MTNIINALKYWYLDGLRFQLNEAASPFLAKLENTQEHVEGYKIKMPLSYGTTGGIGMRSDSGTLPTVNPRKFAQAEWETLNIFARIQVTDKAIQASASSRGAFISALTHDLEAAEKDAKRDLGRQAMGDGTGLLGTITVVSSDGTTHTLTFSTAKKFIEGMLVDLYNYGDGDGATKDTSEAEITTVDKVNNQIILVATHAPVAGDKIYLAGNKDGELTGVAEVMTADNTLYGIVRGTYKYFNPTTKAVTGEISEIKIQEGIDDAEDEVGNVIDFLMAEKGVIRAYKNLLGAMKMSVNTIDIKGGFKAVTFNGIPLVGDRFCTDGELLALSMKNWKMYEMADWGWLDADGNMLTRVSQKPIWEATLRKYCDIGCDLPKGQVKFTGITRH